MMISQVRKHYKEFKFSRKSMTKVLSFILLLYLLWFIFEQLRSANYFPITEVQIVGVHHEHQEMQKTLLPLVKKGFFLIDVSHIKERLLQFSWVAEASVRRVWPNTVIIQVTEKKPLARWNHQGLLTTSGEIFNPAKTSYTLTENLPDFIGPEGEQVQMLNFYKDVSKLFAPIQFKISQLELTPSHSWSLTFTNGVKLNVGYKDVLTRINHFVKVYPKIVGERINEVDYIDLRYSNGLAVRWKA